MTKEEILAMEAGRELNALVDEEIMHTSYELYGRKFYGAGKEFPLAYSTDISAAWQVVDKMSQDGWRIRITERAESSKQHWGVCFIDYRIKDLRRVDRPVKCAFHQEIPEAICKAALLARLGDAR